MKADWLRQRPAQRAVLPAWAKNLRITIRLDKDIIEIVKSQVEAAGGGNYQTLLNDALRIHRSWEEPLEKVLRRVVPRRTACRGEPIGCTRSATIGNA